MSESNYNHRDLQRQLDEAGRLCQPRDPGWDTLLDRALQQGPDDEKAVLKRTSSPGKGLSWRIAAMAAAIVIAIVLGSALLIGPGDPARAETLPIEVQRRGIQVTVFSASDNREPTLFMPVAENPTRQSPGMALVKDQRMVLHLQKGDNLVKFTDVAATIDPTSVRLVSDTDPIGTKVVQQNFEFDLASADALLKRAIDGKVACVGRDGQELIEGYLLSFDAQDIVLADEKPSHHADAPRPKTQTVSRNKLQAVRLERMPTDLYTRPTLVWTLRTDRPGNHLTTLTYLCGEAVWRADYVAAITDTTPDEDTIHLKGWVTIDNRSGATYQDAGLKLIAGDVNRVRDPWAPRPPRLRTRWFAEERQGVINEDLFEGREFIEKSFFEYKLYTLNQPSTIKDRQIKQLSLLEAAGVKARRRYLCRSGEGGNLHPEVQLLIENEKQNNLGRPFPKGLVTLTAADADGDSHLLGRQTIDHTPKDEQIKLTMGRAFDVVYGYRVVDTKRPTRRRMIQTYEFRVRNHKPQAIHVRLVGKLAGRTNWTITQHSDEYIKHDFQTLHFDFRQGPDTEKTVTYTVDYRW